MVCERNKNLECLREEFGDIGAIKGSFRSSGGSGIY